MNPEDRLPAHTENLGHEELRRSEARFRTLAETTSAGTFIIQDAKIRYANRAARIITGYEPDELLGMTFWTIAHPLYQNILKDNPLANQWDESLPARYELKLLHKSGEERWVDLTAGEIDYDGRPAFIVTLFDITERDQAEQALRLANKELAKTKAELEARVAERTMELNEINERLAETNTQLAANRERIAQAHDRLAQVNQQLKEELTEREHLLVAVQREQQRAECAAGEARQRAEELRAVFNAMTEAVTVYDDRGVMRQANAAAIHDLGFDPSGLPRDQIVEQLVLQRPGGERLDPEELPTNRALQGAVVNGERLLLENARGENFTIVVSSAPIYNLTGEISGAVTVWHDITERERLLEQLEQDMAGRRQAEETRHRLAAILEATPDLISTISVDGKVLYFNRSARHLLGLETDDRDRSVRLSEHPEWSSECVQREGIPAALEHGMWSGENLIATPAGKRIPVSQVILAHRSTTGEVAYLSTIVRDITAIKQAEVEMRRTVARAEVLAALSQAFAEAGLQYHQVLRTVVQRIGETTGEACLVRLISDDRLWLDLVALYHPDTDALAAMNRLLQPRRLQVGEGVAGEVYQSGRSQIVADLTAIEVQPRLTAEFQEWAKCFPAYSSLTVPLRAQHRPIGTLSVLRTQPGRPFTPEDQEFFQELADRAALSIDNARLYVSEAQRVHELDALHRASAALLSTLDFENLLSHILDAALSAIRKADGASLHLIAPDTGQLQLRASLGYSDPRIQKVALPQLLGYPAQAISERRPMLISDFPESRAMAEENNLPQLRAVRAAIVAPLILGPKVLGVLSLTSSQSGTFNQSDLRLLDSFATTTTTAIQNAMLHTEVQRQAITDGLTRLYNRRGFAELAQREIERARLFHHPLSLVLMDIDHFKNINDTYGHPTGDQVLRILGERLGNSVREVDIIGRHGGEEFVVLLPETDLFAACRVAERIREQVARPIVIDGDLSLQITASFGVARVTNETQTLGEMLDQADKAMYMAKHRGRNRVEVG